MAFPQDRLSTRFDLYLNGEWRDITSDVRGPAQGGAVSVVRGRAGERGRATPTRANLTIDNRSGKYSSRNPNSPYFGLLGRNTPLRVVLEDVVTDAFGRTTANGWGTSDDGMTWSVNGTAAEYSVSAGAGRVTFNEVNVSRYTWLSGEFVDLDFTGSYAVSELATGAELEWGLTFRYQDGGEHYWARLVAFPNQSMYLDLVYVADDGTTTTVDTAVLASTHVANTYYKLRVVAQGSHLQVKSWLASATEPDTWDVDTHDSTLGAAGRWGTRCRTATGNTNGSIVFLYDAFTADEIRCAVEVPRWPADSDPTDSNVYTPIEGSGILRRLQQGNRPLKSKLRRGLEVDEHVAYWPMEDSSDATHFASADSSGYPLVFNDGIDPGASSYEGLGGSSPLALVNAGGSLRGTVGMSQSATEWTVQVVAYVVYDGATDADLLRWATPGGTPAWWRLRMGTGSPPGIRIEGCDATINSLAGWDGLVTFSGVGAGSSATERWVVITVTAAQNGANVDYSLTYNFANEDAAQSASWSDVGTLTSISRIDTVYLSAVEGTALGHVFVAASDVSRNDVDLMGALVETAGNRILRLCTEEGIPITFVGDPDETAEVGPQTVASIYDLLQRAADVDGGLLYDSRGEVGLTYRTQRSLYNQHANPRAQLDYSAGHLAHPFRPVEDDQNVRNDVTVSRQGGSSYRYAVTSGPLNVNEPDEDPDGVGVYQEDVTLDAWEDDQLAHLASWRAHLGTWDEARYPSVSVDLARTPIASSVSLTRQVAAVDLGDCVTVDNLPDWRSPDLVELTVQGCREQYSQRGWRVEWNASPAGVHRVFEVEDNGLGRADTTGSTLATGNLSAKSEGAGSTSMIVVADVSAVGFAVGNSCRIYDTDGLLKHDTTVVITSMPSGFGFTQIHFTPAVAEATTGTFLGAGDFIRRVDQTSLSVATTLAGSALWTTDASDFPLGIVVGGERMTVTAVAGGTSPQTFTVTRSVNGIQKAHPAGTAVELWRPGVAAPH